MKNILVIINLLVAVVAIYLLSKSFLKEKELVYINTPKLLGEYQGMKDAQKELESKAKQWQANVDTLASELEASIKKYEKDRVQMSKKEISLTEELLKNKQEQFLQYQQAMRQKVQEEDQKLKEKLLTTVNSYMKQYGKDHNYDYILGATSTGNLVYADEALDITDDVIKGLNATYNKAE